MSLKSHQAIVFLLMFGAACWLLVQGYWYVTLPLLLLACYVTPDLAKKGCLMKTSPEPLRVPNEHDVRSVCVEALMDLEPETAAKVARYLADRFPVPQPEARGTARKGAR